MTKCRHLISGGIKMKITGTFLDEISHDGPHQNWGMKEWDRDFVAIEAKEKAVMESGINAGWKIQ